jgi:hypothetical protein
MLTGALFTFIVLIQHFNIKKDIFKPRVPGDADDEHEAYILRLKSPLAAYVDVVRFYAGLFHSTAFSHHVQIGPHSGQALLAEPDSLLNRGWEATPNVVEIMRETNFSAGRLGLCASGR